MRNLPSNELKSKPENKNTRSLDSGDVTDRDGTPMSAAEADPLAKIPARKIERTQLCLLKDIRTPEPPGSTQNIRQHYDISATLAFFHQPQQAVE